MTSALVVGTNTYVTLAEADTHLGDAIGAESWGFLDDDTKNRALLTAFRLLERQQWQGDPVGSVQWPAVGVIDCDGNPVDDATVPADIKAAQIELAYLITVDNTIVSKTTTFDNTKRLKAGSAEIEFFNADGSNNEVVGRFPPTIMELIRCYLSGPDTAGGAESFGTECPPDLDPDRYDRSQAI